MRPDEWQRAMENEAASVEDEGWARDTRVAARLTTPRHFFVGVVVALLALEGLAVGMIGYSLAGEFGFLSPASGVPYGLTTSLLALGMAYLLGRARLAPLSVALAAAIFPALLWLTTALITVPVSPGHTSSAFDALPTWPLVRDSGALELVSLLARAGAGYFGAQAGLRAADRALRLRKGRV